jgi:hypothetical protein
MFSLNPFLQAMRRAPGIGVLLNLPDTPTSNRFSLRLLWRSMSDVPLACCCNDKHPPVQRLDLS